MKKLFAYKHRDKILMKNFYEQLTKKFCGSGMQYFSSVVLKYTKTHRKIFKSALEYS